MSKEEFEKILIELANSIDVKINEETIYMFYQYMKEIIEWNDKVNLTAITDEKMFIVKHFIDSLTVVKKLKIKILLLI